MNEPFLLSNLIDLQNLDNEIFKLIAEKSQGESVNILKNLEKKYNESTSLLNKKKEDLTSCLLYTSPSPRDVEESRMPSSA